MDVILPFFQQVSDLSVPPGFSTKCKIPNCKSAAYIEDKYMYIFSAIQHRHARSILTAETCLYCCSALSFRSRFSVRCAANSIQVFTHCGKICRAKQASAHSSNSYVNTYIYRLFDENIRSIFKAKIRKCSPLWLIR